MDDREFEALIDCRFPYGDAHAWRRIVDLGRSISPNAHFTTLDEIARPPAGAQVTAAEQREMAVYWAAGFEHPLKDAVLECAMARIEHRELSVEHVLRVMDEIAVHEGQWGVLVVAVFACDDVEDRAYARFDTIKTSWEARLNRRA